MRPPCIDIELQLVLFEDASLNLFGNNNITRRETTYNKNDEIACYHAWLNFPSIQPDFKTQPNDVTQSQLKYPAKKIGKGFTYSGNVFPIYLTTKNMALHVHFKLDTVTYVPPVCAGVHQSPRQPCLAQCLHRALRTCSHRRPVWLFCFTLQIHQYE